MAKCNCFMSVSAKKQKIFTSFSSMDQLLNTGACVNSVRNEVTVDGVTI